MKVQVADAHAHAQRLVSVVKMPTVLDECSSEEQRSVVRLLFFFFFFFGQKETMTRIFINK
jgi:hypothetical protein